MARKHTYEELERKIKELEKEVLEHKQAEEALRDSKERYRLLFEQSPIGIGLASLDGKVISANRAMEAITGYSIDELKKTNLADTYENREHRKSLVEAVNRHGEVVNYPVRLKRKDGTPYDALLTVSRLHNCGGEDLFQTICIDITERKRAEEALQRAHNELERRVEERTAELARANEELRAEISERKQAEEKLRDSEEKYRMLFEGASDGIFLADAETHIILDANRHAERLIGRPREELIGMPQSKLHPPDHAQYYEEKLRKYVRKGRVLDLQAEVIRKDGGIIPVFISASVVTIHGRQVMQGIFRDAREERRILDLREEIATKRAIEKGKRLLMDRHGISEKEAMSRLQKESRRQRKKVKEIARAVISSELILN